MRFQYRFDRVKMGNGKMREIFYIFAEIMYKMVYFIDAHCAHKLAKQSIILHIKHQNAIHKLVLNFHR